MLFTKPTLCWPEINKTRFWASILFLPHSLTPPTPLPPPTLKASTLSEPGCGSSLQQAEGVSATQGLDSRFQEMGHVTGAGQKGLILEPGKALPPCPWVPRLKRADPGREVRERECLPALHWLMRGTPAPGARKSGRATDRRKQQAEQAEQSCAAGERGAQIRANCLLSPAPPSSLSCQGLCW